MAQESYIAVFAGSRQGRHPSWAEAAKGLGRAIAEEGARLVYGGSCQGLMGFVADGVLEAGGLVLGLVPHIYGVPEETHSRISEVRFVPTVEDRKRIFKELAMMFIALPGGMGTLDEIADVLNSNAQLGPKKPCVLINLDGYFDALGEYIQRAHREGMISDPTEQLRIWNGDPASVVRESLRNLR